jgi:hypothetical protein
MASVNIEQRKSKSGKITFRAKVRLTKKGKILEEQSQTFTNKKLAVLHYNYTYILCGVKNNYLWGYSWGQIFLKMYHNL